MNAQFFQEMFEAKGIRVASVAVLVLLSLFLVAKTAQVIKETRQSVYPSETITVSGDGQATLAPDVAKISFTVENTAVSVATAQAATTKQSNAALEYVGVQGVAEKDVKTLSYNVVPQYAYPNPCPPGALCPAYSSPKVTGYQVSQTIQVTVRDLTKVGDLLAGLGKLSVQNISGPAFMLDDDTAGNDAARADAIAKAKTQAQVLAKQLGVKLGKIVSYYDSSNNSPYESPMMGGGDGVRMSKAADAAPSVPVGENTYRASVSITYEIR